MVWQSLCHERRILSRSPDNDQETVTRIRAPPSSARFSHFIPIDSQKWIPSLLSIMWKTNKTGEYIYSKYIYIPTITKKQRDVKERLLLLRPIYGRETLTFPSHFEIGFVANVNLNCVSQWTSFNTTRLDYWGRMLAHTEPKCVCVSGHLLNLFSPRQGGFPYPQIWCCYYDYYLPARPLPLLVFTHTWTLHPCSHLGHKSIVDVHNRLTC